MHFSGGWATNPYEELENRTIRLEAEICRYTQLESELKRQLYCSESLFDAFPTPAFIKDDQGRYLGCNPAFTEIMGFTAQELFGKIVQDLWPTKNAKKYHQKDLKIIANSSRQIYEFIVIDKNDTTRPVLFSKNVFHDEQGNVAGLIGGFIDITDLKRAEELNRKLQAQLLQAQKMEAIRTLAGGIAHDFNNILSGIFGYSQLAQKNINDPAKANKNIDQVTKGAKRAAELVQQIMTFSRKTEYQKKPFRMYLVINEALKLLHSTLPSTIKIVENLNSRSMVSADPAKVHQLIINLCTNAYHAMKETGGCLTVELTETQIFELKQLKDKKIIPGKYIKLEVSDTGHGMDEKDIEKAFDPYYTTKEMGEGTGFGLAIVQAVVDEHDGYIEVKSSPSKGTKFYIYFPIATKSVEQNNKKSVDYTILKGNEKILYVDDEEAIREIAKKILESYGYEVVLQNNGIEALKEFEKDINQFDIIVTDMNMPGMAGDILSTELKKLNSDIPIILCTGFSDTMTEEKAVNFGINGFLMKPIEVNVLCKKIRQLLDKIE